MSSDRKNIEFALNSSNLHNRITTVKHLGTIFGDNWTFKLVPKNVNKYMIILEREKASCQTFLNMHLDLYSPTVKRKMQVKGTARFVRPTDFWNSWNVNKGICRTIQDLKIVFIKGEIDFHEIPNSDFKSKQLLPPLPETLNTISTDLKQFYCKEAFSDVLLRCEAEVVHAHKVILAVRCPVFAEKFKNKNSGEDFKLVIDDLTPDVLKGMLLFIYTGKAEISSLQSASDLINAAKKYQLNDLKLLCMDYIRNTLTVENISDNFLSFNVCDELRACVEEFKSKNFSSISEVKKWLNIKQEGHTSEEKHLPDAKRLKTE